MFDYVALADVRAHLYCFLLPNLLTVYAGGMQYIYVTRDAEEKRRVSFMYYRFIPISTRLVSDRNFRHSATTFSFVTLQFHSSPSGTARAAFLFDWAPSCKIYDPILPHIACICRWQIDPCTDYQNHKQHATENRHKRWLLSTIGGTSRQQLDILNFCSVTFKVSH